MESWYEEFREKLNRSRERLLTLGTIDDHLSIQTRQNFYGRWSGTVILKTLEAQALTDFDLMVYFDGNPCFGGSVNRLGDHAYINVYTD